MRAWRIAFGLAESRPAGMCSPHVAELATGRRLADGTAAGRAERRALKSADGEPRAAEDAGRCGGRGLCHRDGKAIRFQVGL